MTSQVKKRSQFMIGSPAISSTQVKIVITGARIPPGARKLRGRSGSR